MLSYSIRRGRRADARFVRKLFFAVVREHGLPVLDAPHLDVELPTFGGSDSSRDDFVAVFGGKIVGFVILLPAPGGVGEVAKLFVRRAHRGRGVGTSLLARATEAANARGYETLRLFTTEPFADAHRYYERRGWVRDSAEGAVLIRYGIRLCEAPQLPRIAPPLPWFLLAVLALLERVTRLRARLVRNLATQQISKSADRAGAASGARPRSPSALSPPSPTLVERLIQHWPR